MEKKSSLDSQLMKTLTYLLIFGHKKEGLEITSDGFVLLDDILEKNVFKSKGITRNQLEEVVGSEKNSCYEIQNRSSFNNQSAPYIRLRQLPSINIKDIEKSGAKVKNPSQIPSCIYGTFKDSLEAVKKEGILALPEKCFEFVTKVEDFRGHHSKIESRYNTFIEINVEKALADGIDFFLGQNGTIYSKGINGEIPPKYLQNASIIVKGKVIKASLEEREKKKDTKTEEVKEPQNKEEEIPKIPTIDPNPNLRGTHFKYLCILDFEAQCVDGEKLKVQEIIEFPIVVVDVEQKKITEVFHYYVKPTEYPKLFPFCTELTGITQDKVDNGELIVEVLDKLNAFLEEKGILSSSFCFVTCGDWDLNVCLRCEARAKKIPIKGYLKRWINIKKVYPMPLDCPERKMGMVGLLKISGLELEGRHHSGIDDSMNIARIVIYLLQKQFKFTTSMVSYVNY